MRGALESMRVGAFTVSLGALHKNKNSKDKFDHIFHIFASVAESGEWPAVPVCSVASVAIASNQWPVVRAGAAQVRGASLVVGAPSA